LAIKNEEKRPQQTMGHKPMTKKNYPGSYKAGTTAWDENQREWTERLGDIKAGSQGQNIYKVSSQL